MSKFSAHSTRMASTSAAHTYGVPVSVIMRDAGWTNAGTFAKFYNKSVGDKLSMGQALLDGFLSKR